MQSPPRICARPSKHSQLGHLRPKHSKLRENSPSLKHLVKLGSPIRSSDIRLVWPKCGDSKTSGRLSKSLVRPNPILIPPSNLKLLTRTRRSLYSKRRESVTKQGSHQFKVSIQSYIMYLLLNSLTAFQKTPQPHHKPECRCKHVSIPYKSLELRRS